MFQSFSTKAYFRENYEHFENMGPVSDQPAKLYETAESHKFDHSCGITKENIKFRLIKDHTGTYSMLHR